MPREKKAEIARTVVQNLAQLRDCPEMKVSINLETEGVTNGTGVYKVKVWVIGKQLVSMDVLRHRAEGALLGMLTSLPS
jgi:hypothetical protein